MADQDPRVHLIDLIKDFDTAMLATRSDDGTVRARPMAVQEVNARGGLVFCAGLDSPKIDELHADPRVGVILQGKTKYASLSGNATIDRDRSRIHAMWKEDWKIWFPGGKNDPNLCLIDVDVTEGEYWDNSGARGVRYIVEAAKAYVSGDSPKEARDQNAKVSL